MRLSETFKAKRGHIQVFEYIGILESGLADFQHGLWWVFFRYETGGLDDFQHGLAVSF